MIRYVYELMWTTEDSGDHNRIFGTRKRAHDGAEREWEQIESKPSAFQWEGEQLFADGIYTGYTVARRVVN